MAEISAARVKELREKTGAGMMDCKRALTESEGDLESAVDWLRKKGLSAAAKKAGRVASEGLVAAVARGTVGAVVEVNSETDFVARNERFQQFAASMAELAMATKGNDAQALLSAPMPGAAHSVQEALTQLVATIGENMSLRRVATLAVGQGAVASYVHAALAPGLGKIGVLVALESTGDSGRLAELGRELALQVAAANPQSLDVAGVDPQALERERNVLREQAAASGKAPEIIDKMVEGRVRKYYEEVVLLEQVSVRDSEKRVKQLIAETEKAIGAPVKVAGFRRFALGEGIEKEASDFAAEVAAQAGR